MELKVSWPFSQKSALDISRRILFLSTPPSPLLLRFVLFLCSHLRLFLPRCLVHRCSLNQLYACLVKWIKTCIPLWRSVHFYVRIYIRKSVLHKCIWQLIILATIRANTLEINFLFFFFFKYNLHWLIFHSQFGA